jgi:3-oxoacyl-ACP reductase-like protein
MEDTRVMDSPDGDEENVDDVPDEEEYDAVAELPSRKRGRQALVSKSSARIATARNAPTRNAPTRNAPTRTSITKSPVTRTPPAKFKAPDSEAAVMLKKIQKKIEDLIEKQVVVAMDTVTDVINLKKEVNNMFADCFKC